MKKQAHDMKLSLLFTLSITFSILHSIFNCSSGHSDTTIHTAYLDPGTGTMIISAIVGVFATIALGLKTFWYKLVHIFKPAAKKADAVEKHKVQ